jgi:transcriptional regulator with XRE-family HTH domain
VNFTDKLKLIRKTNEMTQAEFAESIGISRGNLANIERGIVKPTQIFINCVSLMYHVDKNWLLDDNNDDLSSLNGNANIPSLITDKYNQLDDDYKKFIENQINELLKMQNPTSEPKKKV